MENWKTKYDAKLISAEIAAAKVKNGDRIYLGTMCCEPTTIIDALGRSSLEDVEMLQFICGPRATALATTGDQRFRLKTFYLGGLIGEKNLLSEANYVPLFHSRIPDFFRTRRIPIDVAVIQVSEPDASGMFSLGISVDVAKSAVEAARTVIAQVNPFMPRTSGDTLINADKINFLVYGPEKLYETPQEEIDPAIEAITKHSAELINDGSVVHFGFAAVSRILSELLKDRRHLGIHTEIFTDGLCDLIEQGVVDNSTKKMYRGKSLASCCIGTQRAYAFVNENKLVEFYPSDVVLYPSFIGSNPKMVTLNLAAQVDLRGQVRQGMPTWTAFEGSGGDHDFMIGSGLSNGGRSVVCLRSTVPHSGESTIVPSFGRRSPVIMNRGEVNYIVTEYGSAYLSGRSIRERTMALIEIAHPDHREDLMRQARELGYVYPNQVYVSTGSPELKERVRIFKTFKNGLRTRIRVILPTDESLVRDLFYNLSESSVYFRYFSPRRSMPHENIVEYVNLAEDTGLSVVVITGPRENRRMIAEARYVQENGKDVAELAFMVSEEYQRHGIASFLLDYLVEIAKERGVKGFRADILLSNVPMLRLFDRQPFALRRVISDGVATLVMRFDELKETAVAQ